MCLEAVQAAAPPNFVLVALPLVEDPLVDYDDFGTQLAWLEPNHHAFRSDETIRRLGSPSVNELDWRLDDEKLAGDGDDAPVGQLVVDPVATADASIDLGMRAANTARAPPRPQL
jgi:hypothetical protein